MVRSLYAGLDDEKAKLLHSYAQKNKAAILDIQKVYSPDKWLRWGDFEHTPNYYQTCQMLGDKKRIQFFQLCWMELDIEQMLAPGKAEVKP